LKYRVLGRTGYSVSILTIGGCAIGFAENVERGLEAFRWAVSRGLNMVDVAPSYGEAEARLGQIIGEYRDRLVVAEKTLERSREGAWRELRQSLARLRIDYVDLYQLHAVNSLEELDRVFSRDGAMQAFLEARDQGLIKHIGITVHDMRIALKALERFDFDTVTIPISVGSVISPAPENDFRPVLKAAVDRDVGVIAIKAIAKGRWTGEKKYRTWYEPFVKQEDVDLALWYVLSQEGVTTYSMACDLRLWPKMVSAAERYRRLSEEEQRRAIERFRQMGASPLFPADQ